MFVRVDASEDATLTYRPVFPDMVCAKAHPRRPSQPVRIREALEDEAHGWLWHETSIENPKEPYYRVYTDSGLDVTGDILGERYEGEGYTYRDSKGVPVIPYATYHAAETGYLFDPFTMREVVEGSLNIGVLLTYYRHIVQNAAWSQRYVLGAEPMGMETVGADGQVVQRQVEVDPSSLLVLRANQEGGQAVVGQWSPPADPEAILRSIAMYERRILLLAGMQPPDVTRQEADIRSGYSLAVARESVRAQQKAYEPMFRRGDQQLLRLSAIALNRATRKLAYPEDGYRIRYRSIPQSPQELIAQRDNLTGLIAADLMDKVTAYQELHPDLTRTEAEAAVTEIMATNARLNAKGATNG